MIPVVLVAHGFQASMVGASALWQWPGKRGEELGRGTGGVSACRAKFAERQRTSQATSQAPENASLRIFRTRGRPRGRTGAAR
jgi:hypothetical protein